MPHLYQYISTFTAVYCENINTGKPLWVPGSVVGLFGFDRFSCLGFYVVYYYAPAPVGEAGALGGHRHPSSVCPSDVAYMGSNSKTKRPRKTKLCTGVPQVTCDSHTDFKVKSQGHGAAAYCGGHLAAQQLLHSGSTNRAATWRTAVDITSLKYYLILQCL